MAQLLAEQDCFNHQGSTRNHDIRYQAELLFSTLFIARVPASRSLEANELFIGTFHSKGAPSISQASVD
jgi:hypothetical protein